MVKLCIILKNRADPDFRILPKSRTLQKIQIESIHPYFGYFLCESFIFYTSGRMIQMVHLYFCVK